VPTGDGVIISGIAKGFADLMRAGLIASEPRLIAVQPEGSAAIARALRSEAAAVSPVAGAASVADSLTVEMPRNALLALRRVRESGGAGVVVTDEAIVEAIGELARMTGVFAEPAAGDRHRAQGRSGRRSRRVPAGSGGARRGRRRGRPWSGLTGPEEGP